MDGGRAAGADAGGRDLDAAGGEDEAGGGALVDEQATISNSVRQPNSPPNRVRAADGRWNAAGREMDGGEYTGNAPQLKSRGWAR